MPERRVHRDRFVVGTAVRVGSLRILAIGRVVVEGGGGGAAAWVVARKEPWALVIQDGTGALAIGPDGAPVPLETVRRQVPGLDELLAGPPPGVVPHVPPR